MAYAFGDYGVRLFGLEPAAVGGSPRRRSIGMSLRQRLDGLAAGKWTQNILTAAKVVGLAGVVLAGRLVR